MGDALIFIFGLLVSLIAATGGWLYVYARHFRPEFSKQNESFEPESNGLPVRRSHAEAASRS